MHKRKIYFSPVIGFSQNDKFLADYLLFLPRNLHRDNP